MNPSAVCACATLNWCPRHDRPLAPPHSVWRPGGRDRFVSGPYVGQPVLHSNETDEFGHLIPINGLIDLSYLDPAGAFARTLQMMVHYIEHLRPAVGTLTTVVPRSEPLSAPLQRHIIDFAFLVVASRGW